MLNHLIAISATKVGNKWKSHNSMFKVKKNERLLHVFKVNKYNDISMTEYIQHIRLVFISFTLNTF